MDGYLLQAAAARGHRQVALTVHPLNPARRLYERCGFRVVEERRGYLLMLVRLDAALPGGDGPHG